MRWVPSWPWSGRFPQRTPLAWMNLVGNPTRLCVAVAGVGFAAVLMFTQNGFRNALLDSPVRLVDVIDCDLIAISPARYMLPVDERFPRSLLQRAASDPAVASVQPLWIERSLSRVRVVGHPSRPIRVIAVPDRNNDRTRDSETSDSDWLTIPGLADHRDALREPGATLVDVKSRAEYGLADHESESAPKTVEVSGKQIHLVGTVTLGTDFANEGTLLMSESSFANCFPQRGLGEPLQTVDMGLIRLIDGQSVAEAATRLTSIGGGQWQVHTPDALRKRERVFWGEQTPVGVIFLIGTGMGFAVGTIICYQILYTNLQDAMPEFATLKAMGYSTRFFLGVVVRQAFYLSILGFLPAVGVAWGLFQVLESWTGLPMLLTPGRALNVLVLTTSMCLVSGLLALRKLLRTDPASLF